MNGQLILLLLSMLWQTPGGEVFPNMPPQQQGFPNGIPAPPGQIPNQLPIPNHIGWGTDPDDNKFCMIVQISPDKIAEFARTPRGQELTVDIPDEIRSRVQRVVFRVGNEPVERIPANPQAQADYRAAPDSFIVNLDGSKPSGLGTLTPIDKPRPGIYAAAQGGPGFSNTGASSTEPILPPTPSSSEFIDRTRPFGSSGNNTGSPAYDNRSQDITPNGSARPDRFVAPQTKLPPIFQQSNGTAPVANGSYASSAPPYSTPQANSNPNPNYSNNQNNNPYGLGSPNPNYVASNPNTPNFGYDSNRYPPNQQPSPSQLQAQQFGPPVPQPQYLTNNQYPNQPITSLGQLLPTPIGNKSPTPSQHPDGANEEQGKEKFLPFLLLISIVGNVYLGLWMNHLRTRYRILLSNMRGVPISDLT